MWVWVGRKKSLKAGGCVDRRWIEQDLRFMSGEGGKKLKSGRGVSEQTGRLFPTSWGRGTSASTRHRVTAIGCRLGQATLQGQNYREQAWHWEGAGYPVLPPGHPGVSHCASPQAHQRARAITAGLPSVGAGERTLRVVAMGGAEMAALICFRGPHIQEMGGLCIGELRDGCHWRSLV